MNISKPFIDRPIMTALVMAALLFVGIYCFFKLPVSNLPSVDFPVITVSVGNAGASAETMATTVAAPLEKEFMTIPGVTNVTSSNTLGSTTVVLEFNIDKSMDSAAQDVEAAIRRATPRLPANLLSPPTIKKVNPSDSPIMYIALTSDTMPLAELYKFGNTFIGQRLSTIEGIAQVLTYGSPYAVRIQLNPVSLASKGITLQEVAHSISASSPNTPTGQLDGSLQSSIITTDGQLKNAVEFMPVVVGYKDGAAVRVEDLGSVIDSVANTRMDFKFMDEGRSQPTVVLAVQRQPGANTVMVSQAIREALPKLTEQLPSSVSLHIVFDLATSIEDSIHEVELTLLIALLLVVAVIFLYLGNIRDTLIPSVAMPMSIIATFCVMHILGYSLDNLSLLALILATGFIVDDAIVVLENIVRYVEQGMTRFKAALIGSKQISFTILSMTISLVAVFIPMLFMPGLIGKILREFSMTLVIVILASGIISLTLTPMLCSRFIVSRHHKGKFGNISEMLNRKLLSLYETSLHWVMNRRKTVLAIGALSVVLSLFFFVKLPKDFIPDDDIGFFMGFSQTSEGTSPEKMSKIQSEINQIVRKNPNVESFVSLAAYPQTRQGLFFVHLKAPHERLPIQQVIQGLYPPLSSIPGAQVFLKNIPLINLSLGSNTKGAYQYTLQSLDTEKLYAAADELTKRLQNLPLLQGVSSDLEIRTPQLNVDILREDASKLGVSPEAIQETLNLAYSGNSISSIQTPYDQYSVILELLPEYQKNLKALNALYIRSDRTDALVPLSAVSTWKEGIGPSSINHFMQFPAVTISFNLAPNVVLGTALTEVNKITKEVLPPNVMGSLQGAAQKFQETVTHITFLIILAILAMYIVLGILYESFIHPLTILSSLPPAILGGLMTLYVFHLPLSLYGFLGLILLIGIVKKNGIMMVDYALEATREKNLSPNEAIIEACLVRFRPIMMTTLAAIMGALPVAIGMGSGGEARQPLGLVIIGGLVLSQLITLYLTPVIYLYLDVLNHYLTPKKHEEPISVT